MIESKLMGKENWKSLLCTEAHALVAGRRSAVFCLLTLNGIYDCAMFLLKRCFGRKLRIERERRSNRQLLYPASESIIFHHTLLVKPRMYGVILAVRNRRFYLF